MDFHLVYFLCLLISVVYANNSPVCAPDFVTVVIPEDASLTSPVASPTCSDSDAGADGTLSFSFTSGNGDGKFQINPTSGAVTVNGGLDYETTLTYTLEIQVSDGGSPPLATNFSMYVQVGPVNEFDPVITNPSPVINNVLETSLGTAITTVAATDDDDGRDGELRYAITGGNDGRFHIDKITGGIYAVQPLDYEQTQSYSLQVEVTDLSDTTPRSTDTTVTINLKNVNEFYPTCQKMFYKKLNEDSPNNRRHGVLARIGATCSDLDDDGSRRFPFSYAQRRIADYTEFQMHPFGNYRLLGPIDPDTEKNIYYQEVLVKEFGINPKLTVTVGVVVEIVGVDDNPTVWTSLLMDLDLPEDQAPGETVITTLVATDADPPTREEGRVLYGLTSQPNDNQFIVHSEGSIYLAQPLDRELDDRIVLNVYAYTANDPGTKVPATVTINVIDVNDNAPNFNQPVYYATAIEGTDYTSTPIAAVLANDPDVGVNANVAYSIIAGDPSGLFVIDSNSGDITAPVPIDYDVGQVFYELTVQAEDGGSPSLNSTVLVVVDILPVNEFDPVQHGTLDATVSESDNFGTIVFNFNVSDSDDGLDGEMQFSGITTLYPFGIDPNTGQISLIGDIDRETQSVYLLDIMISDRSETTRRSVSVTVTVNLLDANDNEPVCDPIVHAEISTLDGTGTEIVQLICSDADIGANADLGYTIVSGNDNGDIIADANGKVILANPAGLQNYAVEILVEDKGSPVLNTSLNLLIDVAIHPLVANLPAVLSFPENTSIATVLLEVNTTSNGALNYEILSGNEEGRFAIGRSSGILYLAKLFDKEINDNFLLEVQITDVRTGLSTLGNITVSIDDVNDNPPVFVNSFYNIQVIEDIASGTEIIDLDASDADVDVVNRQISYAITSGNSDGQFSIDANGKITVVGSLNFENVSLYQLDVEASDNGPFWSLTGLTTVQIEVVNKDEFPAVFNFSSFNNSISIPEDFALGNVIVQLNATDFDGDIIIYDFISADSSKFEIDKNGKIYLIKLLDREVLDRYDLVVRARNPSGLSSTASFEIQVSDVNDNDPQFSSSVYTKDILESEAAGTSLIDLAASDIDIGNNANLTYSIIAGNTAGHFRLDSSQLLTDALLNFDTTSYYKLVVEARDQGSPSRSSTAVVTIQVLQDATPPKFLPNIDNVSLLENTATGTEVYDAQATALGAQENGNGTLEYSIVSGNVDDVFAIGVDSGKVFLTGPVDADKGNDAYQLIIQAVSNLDTSLTDTLTLDVIIGDLNDNPPVFTQTQYVGVVSDGSAPGTYILFVNTSDADRGTNAQVSYSLSGVGNADFSINPFGQVDVANTIDVNVKDRYTLAVHATNVASPALTAEAILIITVQSDQNTAPTYSSPSVSIILAEDVGVGSIVSKLVATDPDSGPNGNLFYSITSGDPSGIFSVGSNDGTVTVAVALDRETEDFYQLEITCADGGTPSLSATILLNINITDVNDNDPVFMPSSYSVSTITAVNVGYQIGQVTATDIDQGYNSLISYSISSGNGGNLFAIDPYTGVVTIDADLSAAIGSHPLTIEAKDSGTSPRSSTTTFTITVSNTPNYAFSVLENQPGGAPVGSLAEVGTLTFRIVAGDVAGKFTINSASGDITTTEVLDREQVPQYTLTVHVEETANPANWYNRLVTVTVDDDNDHSPVFSQPSYTVQVMERSPADFSVFKLPVSDNDAGQNANIDLVIVDGISDAVFKVSDATRELLVKTPPEYADRSFYDVQIRAIDGGVSPRSSDTTVRVVVVESPVTVIQTSVGGGDAMFLSLECATLDKPGLVLDTLTSDMFSFNSSNITSVEYFTLQTSQSPFLVDKLTGEISVSNDALIYAESKYIFWVVANAIYMDGSLESRQGMVRVDTFDPPANVIEVTLDIPYGDLAANGEPDLLISTMESLLPTGRLGVWEVRDQSGVASSRRKRMASGTSTVLIYGIVSLDTDALTALNSPKPFMTIADLLAVFQAISDGTPVASLTAGNGTIISILGFTVEPTTAEAWHETSSGVAIITIVCICVILLILVIALYFICTRTGRKRTRPTRSFSKPELDIADDSTMAKPLFPTSQSPPPPYRSRPTTAVHRPKIIDGVAYDGRGVDPDTGDTYYFNSKTGQTYGISGYMNDGYSTTSGDTVSTVSKGRHRTSFDSLESSDLPPLPQQVTEDTKAEALIRLPVSSVLKLRASNTSIGSGFNAHEVPAGSPLFHKHKESSL